MQRITHFISSLTVKWWRLKMGFKFLKIEFKINSTGLKIFVKFKK